MAQNTSDITALNAIDIPSQANIHLFAKRMKDGTVVTIECWGDSTYYGHASGVEPLGTQTAIHAQVAFQTALRSYFNNPNITIINKGTNGHTTNSVFSIWESKIVSSTPISSI
ncbi:hypothetical protein [Neobacillus vireti]|uniref:hypothetical protein n=1 Tax=Neobacillus vireti TaxID=220686 RepID=UPI003000F1E1